VASNHVVYLIQGEDVSGAERMHAALIEADPQALVICPPGSGSERFARALGADVEPLPFRPMRHSGGIAEALRSVPRGLRSALELRRILRRHPERLLIFCTSIRPGMLAALASVGMGRRLLWCVPDFLPPPPLRGVVRLMVRFTAHRTLCLSRAIERDLCGTSRSLAALSEVVYPGVETANFQPLASDPSKVAVLGHVSHVKRTDLAVEIAAIVAAAHPEFRLRIVGTPQFRDEDFELDRELRARVKSDPELREVVSFPGFAADVAAGLGECGALLHCRPDEPFGIALIEAMALGLAVVAPAAAGPLEIVEDGVTGRLYPAGDAAAAAGALRDLIENPDTARSMGEAGRRRVEQRFPISRQLAQTRALMSR
jgi:glycosyltransferase involved in cell wall biosynthesis